METIKQPSLSFIDEIENESRLLRNREYRDRVFRDFFGGGMPDAPLTMEDVTFVGCSLPNLCTIIGTAHLRRVTFKELRAGGELSFSPSVLLDEVSIRGDLPSSLRGAAIDEFQHPADYSQVEWALDLRDFRGEVSFYGPPLEKIRCDPERHVKVHRSRTANVDWDGLGIVGISLWKIAVKRASVCGPYGTVATVPMSNSAQDVRAREELARLREAGVLE